MAFCFRKKQSVEKNLRRLGCYELNEALQDLALEDAAERLRQVRKRIKKTRAVIRLLRKHLEKDFCQEMKKALRKINRGLGPLRDAHVRITTLDTLLSGRDGLPAPALTKTKKMLAESLRVETERFEQARWSEGLAPAFRDLAKAFKHARLSGQGWAAIRPGLRRTYASGRKAFYKAQRRPQPANLHAWRERVKELWYDLRLLRPIAPQDLDPLIVGAKQVSDLLGAINDLAVLQNAVALHKRKISPSELFIVRQLSKPRSGELSRKAIDLGGRLYAEKPEEFCQRVHRYWKRWRTGS